MSKINNHTKIFIGSAWPYANGHLHLGHLAGILGADFLARYFRLKGNDVLFVSGSDCHGTPISVRADKEGVLPAEIADKYHIEFVEMFKTLNFSYDLYGKTDDDQHKKVVQEIFLNLYSKKYIYVKTEKLPYCPKCEKFLPDRYVEGECPKCKSIARGDQCDECGALLTVADLINPKCKFCDSAPEWRDSDHFFLKLSAFQDQLLNFVKEKSGRWRKNARNSMISFLENEKLLDRSITRDIEWGVPIPLEGYENKRIYVWFEAVSGYFSASKKWAQEIAKNENKWKEFWQNKDTVHYYVHGKDNIPFHAIIWPMILMGYEDLNLPDVIISSEYLNLEGRQFSKSKNWAIWLTDFLKDYDSETIRFYIGLNGPENADSDFIWDDFVSKINNVLIGKFGNLVNRTFTLIHKNFVQGVKISRELNDRENEIINMFKTAFNQLGDNIEAGKFSETLKEILKLADEANKHLAQVEPWKKISVNKEETAHDLAFSANLIKNLAVLAAPFLPKSAKCIADYINFDYQKNGWQLVSFDEIKVIKAPKPIYKRVEKPKE